MLADVNRLVLVISFVIAATTGLADDPWNSRRLTSEFHAEGAGIGDIDGDGKNDVAYGPFWYAGPEFEKRNRFTVGEAFSPIGYSDNFFSFVQDITGDGHRDIVVFGFPGKEVRLFVNPGEDKLKSLWPSHTIVDQLCHEATSLIDLIPGGLQEIVGARDNAYGFYSAGPDPKQPWIWNRISMEGRAEKPFGHGMGVGDVNGDGRLDVIEKTYWYEQPSDASSVWPEHRWASVSYGSGGAQILVDDVDDDGDSDLITSLNAHGSGIAWFEQTRPGNFARHDIIGTSSTDNPYGVSFREPHGMTLADIDGDGRMDFVSGKRWHAHNGRDPGAYQEPVVYWFRNVKTPDGIDFVPHLVDNASGIGVGVPVVDLNSDGLLDIVSANKRGLTLQFQTKQSLTGVAERWKVIGGRPQEDYASGLSPQEALKKFEVPEGFAIDLIASEPQVTQPIAMCFDARGRLWVVEGLSYPVREPEGQGKDRVLIFEDTDGDGEFDSRKVFAEKLNLVSGIQVGFGGIYLGAAPYLLFIADKNEDDIPDGEPEVLLDGWGYQDTHETLNAFAWGPDGWLYGCHGVFTRSLVGKPGTQEKDRIPLNAAVWRFHPVRKTFEIFSEGSSNPWGVDFDAHGDAFITACVIPHLYHVSQGGRYTRQAGQHFHPYVFDDIDTIADHLHFVGRVSDNAFHGQNRDQPPAVNLDTSALGGGHAHCGLAIYQADQFPPTHQGNLFFSNLHGHRIVRERLERDGSGFIARHMPDFALAHDNQFIGVSVIQGPDGAIYVSDWYDKQTCHHRDDEIWNRSNGRIYRVRYGAAGDSRMNLAKQCDAELVGTLAHRNVVHARLAQRLLQERVSMGKSDIASLRSELDAFEKKQAIDAELRLRAVWTLHACGLLTTNELVLRLADPSEHVRGWVLQLLGESKTALPTAALDAVEKHLAVESSMITRRYAASLLQRLPLEQRWNIAEALIRHANDQHDRNLPLLTWYGVEPLVEADPGRVLAMSEKTVWPQLREFIARRAAMFPEGRESLMTTLSTARDQASYVQRATQLLLGLAQLPPVQRPMDWPAARAAGEKFSKEHPSVIETVRRLGARFGDSDFFAYWRSVARDRKARSADRIEAIELLHAGGDPEIGALARDLLDEPPLLAAAVRALRSAPGIESAQALVARMSNFPLELRNEAINLLAMRPEMALKLLQAVDEKKLAPSLISSVMLDQFDRFNNNEIIALIDRHWKRGGAGVELAKLSGAIREWSTKLNPTVIERADASRGRLVFQKSCGICHQLFGEGIALGPDLTGSNRANLAYVLENVLAPSAVVGRDYLINAIMTTDDTVVTGIVRGESPEFVTLMMAAGTKVDVKKTEIVTRKEMTTSMMPTGLFDTMPLSQVADLVKYLASPVQVPLPDVQVVPNNTPAQPSSTATPLSTKSTVTAPPKGVTRIEAESLRPKHANFTGGDLRTQDMAGFKNDVWSGGSQLFWVSVQLGHTLTLTLPDIAPGTHDVTLFPTLARDYGRFRLFINSESQEADLYHGPFVKIGSPIIFRNVTVTKDQPLKVVVEPIGANAEAQIGKFGYVFGLDRIEVSVPGGVAGRDVKSNAAASPRVTPSSVAPQPAIPQSSLPLPSVSPKTEPIVTFAKPASGPLRIEKLEGALAITTIETEPVELARFVVQPPPNSLVIVPSAAYVHPLRTPSGIDVTAFAPGPHRYYRGLFMGYVDVRGTKEANFWGGGGGPIQGSVIVCENASVKDSVSGIEGPVFRARNTWQKDGVILVREDVQGTAQLDGSATILDLVYTFTSDIADVRLAHCNVGGLALPVRYDGQLTAHGPDGPVKLPSANYRKNETNWPAAAWYGYTVKLPGDYTISAAIINHPSNPETRWHCALGARVINPNITTDRELPLKVNEPLTLRYRVVAQDGAFDTNRMNDLVSDYTRPK